MGERYDRDDLDAFGFSAEPCPLCDDDRIVTKDDVVEHLLSVHSPLSLAVYVALTLFIGEEDVGA